jgi:hypothetical protein
MTSTNTPRSHDGRALTLRLIVTAVGISAWFWTQSLISQRPVPASGIGDGLHLLSAPLNQFFFEHPTAANGLMIVSSGVIDVLAIFLLAEWIFGRSTRPFLGLAMLLGLRQVMEVLCALPNPDNTIWHYPGFPSLLVTYGVGNDYFFSGHTAIAVFAGTELARLGWRWLKLVAIVVVLFEVVTVLVLRAHYTMDVFTGVVAALYVARLSEELSPPLDRRLAKYLHSVG